MGEFSIYHWLLVLLIVVLLFGGRRIPELMRGLGGGVRSFRDGLRGGSEESTRTNPSPSLEKEGKAKR
jgi:sec-independent protein translocase protein TatA